MFEGIIRRPGSYFRVWPHFYINKPDIVGRSIQLFVLCDCCVRMRNCIMCSWLCLRDNLLVAFLFLHA